MQRRATACLLLLMTAFLPLTAGNEDKVDWSILREVAWEPADQSGEDFSLKWPDGALALRDKVVTVTGFMFPLDEVSEDQSHFLLTSSPMAGCAFCIDFGPESVIEIKLGAPLEYSAGRVTITGKLELLDDDPTGLFYRIQNGKARHGG